MSKLLPIQPQTLNAIRNKDIHIYETSKKIIDAHNNVVAQLSPGDPVSGSNFTLPLGLSLSGVAGTFIRGKVSVTIEPNCPANPSFTLLFPRGLFEDQPFATVVRNGGNGQLGFSYTESPQSLIVKLSGAPLQGTEYAFQWLMRP